MLRRTNSSDGLSTACSVRDVFEYLLGGGPEMTAREWESFLSWPPDVFALAGSILHESGAYAMAVEDPDWPPRKMSRSDWCSYIQRISVGDSRQPGWRKSCIAGVAPQDVQKLWKIVLRYADTPLCSVAGNKRLWQALVELCSICDEACAGAGIPPRKCEDEDKFNSRNEFQNYCHDLLSGRLRKGLSATLCKEIDSSRAAVLPKMHTPLNGITFRSMTHNLALIRSASVHVNWVENEDINIYNEKRKYGEHLNILIVPWPFEITPSQFRPVMLERVRKLAPGCRYFSYTARKASKSFPRKIKALVAKASSEVGKIDGLIFPELALTEDQYQRIRDAVVGDVEFVVAGIGTPALNGTHGENYAKVCALALAQERVATEERQDKHHRWFLEQRQIERYGLAAGLDPGKIWWESVSIRPRRLSFFATESWLTFTVLICEDLARPDPVGEVLRAVGPNLVISLLLDGPQLKGRWSERSASVLADDPGSSVLTLTSLGMIDLQSQRQLEKRECPRAIALWKDPTEVRQIDLPPDTQAVVLSVSNRYREEWSADGRSDGRATGTLRLAGVHPIKFKIS